MATVRDIITRALARANLIPRGEAAPAEDAAEALRAYNDFMWGLNARGVDFSHTEQDLNGTFPLADKHREGVVFMLAERLADETGLPLRPSLDPDDWLRTLQADYRTKTKLSIDAGLQRMPSQYLGSYTRQRF